jgi:large subunit ribosomal protein L21
MPAGTAGIPLFGGSPLYAVVRTGGKQYRVEEGRRLKVERLAGEVGDSVELADVLLMSDGDAVTVGAPAIEGARVLGTIEQQGRSQKVIVFRYKAKTRSRKKTGHRQAFTTLVIDDILAPGQEPKPKQAAEAAPEAEPEPVEVAPRGRRRRQPSTPEATASEEPPAEAIAPGDAEETAPGSAEVADAPPASKPRRSRRKAE